MTLLDKEPVKRVEGKLRDFNPDFKVIILDTSARTAQEAASSLGCDVGAIVKSLLFKTDNTFTLCLIAGDKKASLNKIKKTLFQWQFKGYQGHLRTLVCPLSLIL